MTQKAQQIATAIAQEVIAGRLCPGDKVPTVRTVARDRDCAPGTAARAHRILRQAGVITGAAKSAAVVTADGVAQALRMSTDTRTIRLCGSDDPALDLVLGSLGSAVERASDGQGSVAGLGLLARGSVDATAMHLQDAHTGRSNDTFARRVLGGRPARLVHLWRREQGIVVPAGNPSGIQRIRDLAGKRLAWRPAGTGSRLLLARLLRASGVSASDGELCCSHLAVAAAVAVGAVDAGLAVRSVAEAVGADFVPVQWEDFELAVEPESLSLLAPMLDVLASSAVHDRLSRMSGYDLRRSGERRVAA